MYAVSTSCPWSTVAWNTWMMRGRATLTMVWFRTTTKVPSTTAMSACQW